MIQIGRAYRPGYGMEHAVIPPEVVSEWIIGIKAMEARSVICLLSKPELEWYSHLPGGLLETYQAAGLDAVSIPVPMDPGVLAGLSLLGTLKVTNPSKRGVLRSKVCTTLGLSTGRLVGS